MSQQGQVFVQRSTTGNGEPRWGFRYRLGGREAARVQRGGFASEHDARQGLARALERLHRSNGIGRTLTFAELVNEYLDQHDAQPERSRSCAGCSPRQ